MMVYVQGKLDRLVRENDFSQVSCMVDCLLLSVERNVRVWRLGDGDCHLYWYASSNRWDS